MAQKKDYGLPDETLQLIAAAPELFAGGNYLQSRGKADTSMPGSDLIAALRSDGTNNAGFSQYANGAGPQSASARTARRGLFNPNRLAIGRVTRDVTLPGAETQVPTRRPRIVVESVNFDDDVIDDPVDDPVDPLYPDLPVPPDVPVGTPIVDVFPPTGTPVTIDGGTGNDTLVGGTGNDTITGGGGNDGPNLESSIAAILAARLAGTGGTGGGDGGSGTGGTGGLTGSGTTGGTGTTKTTTAATSTSSDTGTLRDAISRAVDGTASVDGAASGADAGAGSSSLGSSLTADQLAALTKPKVPTVTLESSGPALDDNGSLVQTFDYPELLSPEDLKVYEEWMKQNSGIPGGGAVGGGKPADDTYGNILEM